MSPNLRYTSFLPFFFTFPLPHTFIHVPSLFFLSSSYGFLYFSFFHVTFIFQDVPEPISIYYSIAEELSASIGTPMEGFFEGVDVMFGTTASAAPAAAQGVSVEAPILFTEPIPMEGTHTEKVSEATPIFAKTPTPQVGAIPDFKSYCDNCNNHWDILPERIGCRSKALIA